MVGIKTISANDKFFSSEAMFSFFWETDGSAQICHDASRFPAGFLMQKFFPLKTHQRFIEALLELES